jgi:phosphopantetheinyl transferase
MPEDDSDRIKEYFSACTLELTPEPARHAATVLFAPVSHDPDVLRLCGSALCDSELHRASRFADEREKAQFIQRRAFRHFCGAKVIDSAKPLSRIIFAETENGRPHLPERPNYGFSFSSCRFGFLGGWSLTHGIGLDIEDRARRLEVADLARYFFSLAEANAVESVSGLKHLQTFFQFWTLKEAALKSIGEGLPFGLRAFEFELEPALRLIHVPSGYGKLEQFSAHLIERAISCAALVLRRRL